MAPCFAGPVGNSAYSDWLSQPGLDYLLIGLASGAVLAAGLAALAAGLAALAAESRLLAGAMPAAIVLTIAAAAGRAASGHLHQPPGVDAGGRLATRLERARLDVCRTCEAPG